MVKFNERDKMTFYTKYLAKKNKKQKSIRRAIGRYFDESKINRSRFEITDIQSKFKSNKIIVTITLDKPGLLIGKGGRGIDQLIEYLTKRFDKEVRIKIIESKLWW